MKRILSLISVLVAFVLLLAACTSDLENKEWVLDQKHNPLPDYVLSSSDKVQETYVIASTYPEVVAQVPCFCGCDANGHKSNLDCFVQRVGENNAVEEWDSHGIA